MSGRQGSNSDGPITKVLIAIGAIVLIVFAGRLLTKWVAQSANERARSGISTQK